MSCFWKPSSIFSFISIHKSRWSPTTLPKDNNPLACHKRTWTVNSIDGAIFWLLIFDWSILLPVYIAYCIGESLCFHPCVYLWCFNIPVPHKDNFSPRCIHFDISKFRSIQNWVLRSFWILIIVMASNCCLYAPIAIAITIGKYVVIIMVLAFFSPHRSIHEQQPRFLNSLPVAVALHDTSFLF